METGNDVRIDQATQRTMDDISCVGSVVLNADGVFPLTSNSETGALGSVYRPAEYQQHFRDIWDRLQKLRDVGASENDPACGSLYRFVRQEAERHKIANLGTRPAGGSGPHVEGQAFDLNYGLLGLGSREQAKARLLQLLSTSICQVYQRLPVRDDKHWEHNGYVPQR